jgi:hypothetical protein
MIAGTRFVLWQRRAGILAMVFLIGALLAMADALVGGLKGNQTAIELIPDSRFLISGPMPAKTEAIKDFVIDGQPADGSVRLVPETIFTGYWFGGSMWRGAIVVDPFAREGSFVISVKDRFGEKQNPALVFTVRIWPDQATLNAHSSSFLTRKTNRSPYLFAIGLVLCGFAAGGVNFLLGRLWARHLASHNCGEIYKLRRTERGTEITCELRCGGAVKPGMEGAIYRASGEPVCAATVSSCEQGEVLMLVSEPELVHLGDVACVQLAALENPEP